MKAEFIISAADPDQFPGEEGPEYAFLGRSNVGKSTLLNSLLDSRRLARTSAAPGCTQGIHFYLVEGETRFVDLPGYGYAKVPAELQRSWKRLIEAYLLRRRSLELCFLLVDARRGWMRMDRELKQWLEFHGRRYLVIATKFDKLRTQKEKKDGLAAIRAESPDRPPVPFSAVTGQGVREIWQAIRNPRTQP
jgi:GTP-binding protein